MKDKLNKPANPEPTAELRQSVAAIVRQCWEQFYWFYYLPKSLEKFLISRREIRKRGSRKTV